MRRVLGFGFMGRTREESGGVNRGCGRLHVPDQPTFGFTVWGSGLGVEYPGCEEGARSAWLKVRGAGSGDKIED